MAKITKNNKKNTSSSINNSNNSNNNNSNNNKSTFIRIKNRTAPIYPQSEGIHINNGPKKKYKEIYSDKNETKIEWEEEIIPSSQPPPFNPYKTQIKRAEKKIISAESKIRKDNSPCIDDLLKMRQGLLKEKEIEQNRDMQRMKQLELISKLEDALGKGQVFKGNYGNDSIYDDIGNLDEIEDEFIDYDDENEANAEFKERSIYIKERKYVAGRGSAKLHDHLTRFQIYRIAIRIYWSLTSTRVKPVSYVLPWMYLGSKTTAANLEYLLQNGFTHILNVTQDVPNYHPDKFVYQRISIADSETEDIGSKFKTAISFIQRVARCRGKIFVHCNAGNSRSPTIIMAYFIAVRKITLKDIFDYLQLVRISVFPNRHFLFQLSDLELAEGLGSSVRYAEEWKHYEYNEALGKSKPVFREPEGVYTTTCKIHRKDNTKLDFVDELEAELRRREVREKNHVSQIFSMKL